MRDRHRDNTARERETGGLSRRPGWQHPGEEGRQGLAQEVVVTQTRRSEACISSLGFQRAFLKEHRPGDPRARRVGIPSRSAQFPGCEAVGTHCWPPDAAGRGLSPGSGPACLPRCLASAFSYLIGTKRGPRRSGVKGFLRENTQLRRAPGPPHTRRCWLLCTSGTHKRVHLKKRIDVKEKCRTSLWYQFSPALSHGHGI